MGRALTPEQRERKRLYRKAYRAQNGERLRAERRERYARNKSAELDYQRSYRARRAKPKLTVLERFTAKVRVLPNGCWEWTAHRYPQGYGAFFLEGRHIRAHVFTYQAVFGPVPDGMELDHLCRYRPCCNPFHVAPVTHRENILRGNHPNILIHHSGACARGHTYTEENTYVTANGTRACRTCHRDRERARRLRRKAGDDWQTTAKLLYEVADPLWDDHDDPAE